jgi:NADPH:quinone reductase-like Zn-dependent oxidoreductase
MRAVRFHRYGPPEELVVEQVPRPRAQEGQVLVHVHASGVNPFDWKLRQGFLKDMMPVPLPHIPGLDLAGTVEAVGPGVTTLQQGDAVFGQGAGTNAEYAAASASSLAPMPGGLTFEQAASVPNGALAAWVGIFVVGGLQSGQRILVHGAAGGVGLCAVQFARWKGAEVIGTASAANVDYVRSLGAETVIDYNAVPFETVVRDVDIVLDTIGGDTLERSWQVLKPGGIVASPVEFSVVEKAKEHGRRGGFVMGQASAEVIRQIADLIDSKALVPHVRQVFRLTDVREAHALCHTGHGRGRIVLRTDN